MRTQKDRLDLLSRIVGDAFGSGIAGCRAEDERTDGRMVTIRGRNLRNFSSCSYLGLELDERLIEGAVRAVRAHGIQTCASRSYLSSPLYDEFETLLTEIFEAHVVVAATTTLGHLSAIPTLVDENDAIILDHQVHASVQMACKTVQAGGVHVEIVPHNGLSRIERRVADLSKRHRQVWYMADGVHSMTGKLAPSAEIRALLERHPKMRFYVDDAHGMSWCGTRGTGSILDDFGLHPRMVLTTGLGKGFGTGGGLVILPDADQCREIRRCGPTLIFGGPIQPPVLGAAIESARIHLTDEIYSLQAELRQRMQLRNEIADSLGVPITSSSETPVGLVAMGPIKAAHALCQRLVADGFYINPAQFPAVPARRSGGRFLLTRHHTDDDIEALVGAIARHWEPSLREGGTSPEEVCRLFKIELPEARLEKPQTEPKSLYLETSESIDKLDPVEWNRLLGDRGCLGVAAMSVYERVFGNEEKPESRWDFRYYIVRDETGEPVLATCFTKALWKADMLSSSSVSRQVEERRSEDPLYLTQYVFAMGCLLSEGDHLWMRDAADSEIGRQAIHLLLEAVRSDASRLGCEMRVCRDVLDSDENLAGALEGEGLIRVPAPKSLVLEDVASSEEELLSRLSRRKRAHQQSQVAPWNDYYETQLVGPGDLSDQQLAELQGLYENVRESSLTLNTFSLPEALLPAVLAAEGWEVTVYRPASGPDASDSTAPTPIVGFAVAYAGQAAYVPLFLGLDYDYVQTRGLYRQILRSVVERSRELGKRRVLFGFGAALEKERFGATPVASSMFIEADDHFAFDALAQVMPGRD